MLKVVDLFSGIGGFSLAAKLAGCETVLFVENDSFCQKILHKRFPGIPILGDIRDVTEEQFKEIGRVDIITAGFPCQPFSRAGKRKGTKDDRYLWPELLRIIKILKPTWVIGENVTGLTTMVEYFGGFEMAGKIYNTEEEAEADFEEEYRQGEGVLHNILGEFTKTGYEVQPLLIPASALNAKHKRERIWIIAYSDEFRQGSSDEKREVFSKKGRVLESERRNYSTTGKLIRASDSEVFESREIQANVFNFSKEELPDWVGGGVREPSPLAEYKRQDDYEEQTSGEQLCEAGLFEYDFCGVAHGVSDRVDRLKALGNAIVPEVAYEIINGIVEIEQQRK